MSLKLEEGRPSSAEGRLEKEIRVYDLLDSIGVSYQRVDHEAAMTMEDCVEIDKVMEPAALCKNLFLCNSQKTMFYLLMTPEGKRFKTKEVSKQLGIARLSFATAEYMEKFLDITPGAVSVMGLMNDKENQVRLLVDEEVLKDEYVGCHPCVNTASLRIRSKDVFGKYLKAVHHDYTAVKLVGEQ